MILATPAELAHQMPSSTLVEKAIAYLRDPGNQSLPDGRYEIDGNRLFAIVQSFETLPVENGVIFEAHKAYIDIQYVADGCERMDWIPLEWLKITKAYDADQDVCFGIDVSGQASPVMVLTGQAAVFFPQDAHAPRLAAGQPALVRKVVIKMAVDGA